MRKSTPASSPKGTRRQRPWVQRTGPPLSPVSTLIVIILAVFLGLMALASAGCTTRSAVSTETADFTVSTPVSLKVTSLNGRIEVAAGSDNVVKVRAELRDIRRIKYEAVRDGDTVIVTAENKGKWWIPASNTEADIYVTVPADTVLRLETSNGRIEVTGTTAGGILETSNGAIVLQDVKGDFEATTSNGAVDIDTFDGTAFVRTSNGKVAVQEAKGEFNIKTSNETISFSGDMTAGGTNRLVTSNEDIDVELTGTPSIHLDASTSNGKVEWDLPITVTGTNTDDDRLVGNIGTGEAELCIETSNGDVTIK